MLVRADQVVACGGLGLNEATGHATLDWGMVTRALHGQGIGRQLTQARLDQARATPGLSAVTLATSQHTQGFYAGFGFVMIQIIPDGFGPGIDRWDMTLDLSAD